MISKQNALMAFLFCFVGLSRRDGEMRCWSLCCFNLAEYELIKKFNKKKSLCGVFYAQRCPLMWANPEVLKHELFLKPHPSVIQKKKIQANLLKTNKLQ